MKIITTAEKEVSWEEIKEAAEKHELGTLLKSYDRIPVTLKNGEDVILVVGHDKSGKTYLVFEDCLKEEKCTNRENTNAGGWAATEIRKWLNSTLLALLPNELQAVIKPTKIVQILGGEHVEVEHVEVEDKVFLLSKTQVFGEGSWTMIEPEDTQLDIFSTEKSRVKECNDYGTYFYGLRTPCSGYTSSFCSVYGNGSAGNDGASYSRGVAPSFCLD
jgi:hypothetical protein